MIVKLPAEEQNIPKDGWGWMDAEEKVAALNSEKKEVIVYKRKLGFGNTDRTATMYVHLILEF
jgi:hypothetical protein